MAQSSLPTSTKLNTAPWLGIGGLLLVLSALHVIVDTSACIVTPLWPELERHLVMSDGGVMWLIVLWQISTSFSQFFFGWFADQFRARWLIWVGPCVAVVCMSAIGIAPNAIMVGVFLTLGGLGIAAFHPEAAAAAGSTSPENRSRAMSVFAIGGYLGQAIGPATAGGLVQGYGFPGLLAIMFLLLLILPTVCIPSFRRSFDSAASKTKSEPLLIALRGKGLGVTLVLLIQTLRVITTMGVALTIPFLLDQQFRSTADIGFVGSAFNVGIGVGGVICALVVRKSFERTLLFVIPLLVMVPLWFMPMYIDSLLKTWVLAAVCGGLLGIVLPIMIGYGQQLIPTAQRMASSLTMGVSWGIGGAILAGYLYVLKANGTVESAFNVFLIASAASSVASLFLPRVK